MPENEGVNSDVFCVEYTKLYRVRCRADGARFSTTLEPMRHLRLTISSSEMDSFTLSFIVVLVKAGTQRRLANDAGFPPSRE